MNCDESVPAYSTTPSGGRLRAQAQGSRTDQLGEALAELDPDLIFGKVWAGEGLAFDDRMLVAIVALACGGHHVQLRNYLHGALQAGIDPNRVHEALKMLVVYAGFPTAIAAMAVLRDVRAKYEARP
jgi:4-carboxymuconolactone decarboxylase